MDTELYTQDGFTVALNPLNETENSLQNQMIAMGRALARASKSLSIEEYKLLVMAMTKIRWTKEDNQLEVALSKIEIEQVMGWKPDSSERSRRIRELAKKLVLHSYIQMDGSDKDEWDDGVLIPRMRSTRGDLHLYFAEQFRPLLENLLKDKNFITIWANDIYKFDSVYSYLLFEELRLHSSTLQTNWRTYSTKQLKELFGIPKTGKGSYMHYDAKKGQDVFDRSNFEKKVLDMAIAEINKGQMIQIYPIHEAKAELSKGKLYQKVKKNGYIVGYQFKYIVRTQTVKPNDDDIEGQMDISEWDNGAYMPR